MNRLILDVLLPSFKRGAIGGMKYGYFAPLSALVFTFSRPQSGYFRHLMALYCLDYGYLHFRPKALC